MTKTNPDITSGLTWLEKLLNLYKKYGMFSILKSLLILILLSITLRICYNPTFIFEKYTEYMMQKHNKEELYKRAEYDQQVKNLLPIYLYKYHADRVWIVQYHNRIMDWQHGTMRIELCGPKIKSIKNQYNNFNLTWIDLPYYLIENEFFNYLRENEFFIGDLNQLNSIDPTLVTQFDKNNVKYIAFVIIRDQSEYPIGTFGISWKDIPQNIDSLKPKIYNYLIDDRANIRPLIQVNSIKY